MLLFTVFIIMPSIEHSYRYQTFNKMIIVVITITKSQSDPQSLSCRLFTRNILDLDNITVLSPIIRDC